MIINEVKLKESLKKKGITKSALCDEIGISSRTIAKIGKGDDINDKVAQKIADLTYEGKWYTPLRDALSAFVDVTQETVTGKVKLKLYKGNIIPAGAESPYSLYNENIASFTTGELYNHADANGFINLFGLPIHVKAKLDQKRNNK